MTSDASIPRIVIVGGGTAGWMTAAALSTVLGPQAADITLVESEAISTVGVGEATIPPITLFNRLIGVDEADFVRETMATFKLGIEFVDWAKLGSSYLHSFGLYGADMNGISFVHYLLRARSLGIEIDRDNFNAEALAASRGLFLRTPGSAGSTLPNVHYAYQFDAMLYARFLRRHAETGGVKRIEGRVVSTRCQGETIAAIGLESGETIPGDLFIDCSGFRALLIGDLPGSQFVDWKEWLPCDRALAMASEPIEGLPPYTRATARAAGWQWRIPLQHRTGNGYVFCSDYLSEDEAAAQLLEAIEGKPVGDINLVRFVAGCRKQQWIGNCVALGLSSGFLEPLESTSIHLVQAGIAKLLALFPRNGSDGGKAAQFNAEMYAQYENMRDFIIAHYYLTEREDSPFWRSRRRMNIPTTLADRLERFRSRGEVGASGKELFRDTNWFAILDGQGLEPDDYHPVADAMAEEVLERRLGQIRKTIDQRVAGMPSHADYLQSVVGLR